MNPGVLSVRNNRIVFVAMLLAVIGGFVAYRKLGRLEDPEFTIKEALIITPYPGASAEEVAKEVTNPIESAVPAARPARPRRVGVLARDVGGHGPRHGPVPQGRDPAGVGRAASQDQRRAAATAARRCAAGRWWSTISATSSASSWPSPATATRSRNCAATPSSCAASCCWCRTSRASSSSPRSRKSSSSKSRGNGWRSSASTRSRSTPSSRSENIAADGGRVRVGDQHIAIDPKGAFQLGRRHARAGHRLRPDGPPALSQGRRDARARRSGPAAPLAPVRRQAGHRPGHLHRAGRQRRDDGRRRRGASSKS